MQVHSTQRLIAVLRRPQGILALVSLPTDDAADPYEHALAPLAQVHESICPWRDKDVRAWRALSRVPDLSKRAGLAIVRSIIGSVADPDYVPDLLPPLSFDRGPVDLRPYMCEPDHEQSLLDGLGDVLEQVSADVDFPAWHWKQRQAIAVLPAEFRRSFLWGLHLSPWRQVEHTLAVYEALELETRPALRRAMARLLSLADRRVGIDWSYALSELAPEDRLAACGAVLERGAWRDVPGEEARRALAAREWTQI